MSIVYPYFDKAHALQGALRANLRYLDRPDAQIVFALDQPWGSEAVIAALSQVQHAEITLIRNPRPHGWRSPSKALNVGIKHARGELVMLGEVESYLAADPFEHLPRPETFVLGRVAFATFLHLTRAGHDVDVAFDEGQRRSPAPLFYGCTVAWRDALVRIRGFDESIRGWGGDDDNLRLRLMMAGQRMVPVPDLRTLHVSHDDRPFGHAAEGHPRNSPQERHRILSPSRATANSEGWGTDFNDLVYST